MLILKHAFDKLRQWRPRRVEKKRPPPDAFPRHPRTFIEYLHLRFTGQEPDRPHFNKTQVADLIQGLGLRTPNIYRKYDNPADFDATDLPDTFVLKPTKLWSRKGVMLLQKDSEGKLFWEFFRGKWISPEQIREEQYNWQKRWQTRSKGGNFPLIAEEFLVGENGQGTIPYDYKLYSFDGVIRLIIQINRNTHPPSFSFFINEFDDFDYTTCIEPDRNISMGVPIRPECHREIIAAAKSISKAIHTPFISVDTYATRSGAVIGEITPTPGGYYYGMYKFKSEFDEDLGNSWTEALKRLGRPLPVLEAPVPKVRKAPVLNKPE